MRNIKHVRVLLWSLNFMILLFLVVFAFNKILFPTLDGAVDESVGGAIAQPPPVQVDSDRFNHSAYKVIWSLPNPMEKKKVDKKVEDTPPARSLSSFVAVIGVNANRNHPEKASAVLKVENIIYATAYVAKPILTDDDKPVASLQNYRLVEVHRDKVVFERDGRHREELVIESPVPPESYRGEPPTAPVSPNKNMNSPPVVVPASPVNPPQTLASRLVSDTPERKTWEVDPQERDWAVQNQDAILSHDVSLSVYPSGGVKIETVREGSLVGSRGLQVGDVVKSVNGREVKSLAEARAVLNDPAIRNSSVLRVVVNRAGRLVTLEYKLPSR